MTDQEIDELLRAKARELAVQIKEGLGDSGLGFLLLVFDFSPQGSITWISNAARESMIKTLEDLLERMKHSGDSREKYN